MHAFCNDQKCNAQELLLCPFEEKKGGIEMDSVRRSTLCVRSIIQPFIFVRAISHIL